MDAHYEPLPSTPEVAGAGGDGDAEAGAAPPVLLGSEQWQWEAIPNLDQFFTRIYRYWEEKGFAVMLTSRILNLLALAFTVAMSALLLLYVDWKGLRADCLKRDTCDIWEAAVRKHPLAGGLTVWTGLAVAYLLLFSAYWAVALAHLLYEVRDLAEVKHFCNHKLGISERQMGTMVWPEVAHRLVQAQRRHRLCMARDLTEHDIVARVMRKENFLVGMLNKARRDGPLLCRFCRCRGVLALNVPIPGLRRRLLLTKTLEWNLYWCVLDAMFDDHFRVKPAFLRSEAALQKRLRTMAALNLAASPFLLVFLLIYFFMKNAEKFYHHPSSVGARRWSPLATWRLREFNELPHFIRHRLNASHTAAEAYIRQFPNPVLSHAARFASFVAGSVAALLLVVTLIDERLLERDLFGRQLVWWVAVVGVVLALSRAFVVESGTAFDPEAAMLEVVTHTHYLPRHWRGRAHTREVQQEFEALFQFKAQLFVEELCSILLTPLLLWFSLPQCAGAVLEFVRQHTVHVEGVGDVCSLAAFDFQRHGNARYGAPADAPKLHRSRQGKLEKSFLSFAATYPAWEPDAAGQQLLQQLAAAAGPGQGSLAWSLLPGSPRAAAAAVAAQPQPWPGAGPSARLQAAALASALAAARGSSAARVAAGGSLFGSAELTGAAGDGRLAGPSPPGGLAASLASEGLPPDDRLRASQLLLQSLYEQRSQAEQAAQAHPLQLPRSPSRPAPASRRQPYQQQGAANGAAQQQQQQGLAQGPFGNERPAVASPGRRGSEQPLQALHEDRLLEQQDQQQTARLQQAAAGSPGRQGWLGRSPSGRTRVAELSVLSRENSSSGAATSPLTPPPGLSSPSAPARAAPAAFAAAAAGQGPTPEPAAGQQQGQLAGAHLYPEGYAEPDWQQQQQQRRPLLPGAAIPSAGGEGGEGSGSDGPPEFF